ncbi:MAG TPA: putative peptidoglycan binding domain-containing protein, partial [Gaiellales bacterium]|nr:putative peptidoglycan binding domain-containing protein [Gaiellales bacterium]
AAIEVRRLGAGYGGNNDIMIDLRVDDHPDPVTELARLDRMHDRLFGTTPPELLIPIDHVSAELAGRLGSLGFGGEPARALVDWAANENLEERLHEGLVDPIVLELLRERTPQG